MVGKSLKQALRAASAAAASYRAFGSAAVAAKSFIRQESHAVRAARILECSVEEVAEIARATPWTIETLGDAAAAGWAPETGWPRHVSAADLRDVAAGLARVAPVI